MRPGLWRVLRAQLRDMRVLLKESRSALTLFALLIISGGYIFYLFYSYPSADANAGQRLGFIEALHTTFGMIFFQITIPFPDQWYLQIFFFAIPMIGLFVVVEGVTGFIGAVLNKKSRGQEWQVAMASTYSNHIIVCGVGRLGYRTVVELLKFGREVIGIESDPHGKFVEQTLALGVPLIIADAGRSENLRKAGIEHADAIIPCTDNELRNLDIALDAREANPRVKVVMRMFDHDLARRVEKGFGIHTAFSTSALAAPIFAAAAMRLNVKHSFYVGDELLNISELLVEPGSELAGWTVKQLESALDLSVVSHQKGSRIDIHPSPDLQISAGDVLLVLASIEKLHHLNQLNQTSHSHV